MNPAILAVFAVIFGLAAGVSLGWFLASRPLGELRARLALRESEVRELEDKFRSAIIDLAGASERAARVDALADELSGVRSERESLRADLATLKANAANFDEQKRLLLEAQAALTKEFESAGAKVLAGAQEAFLKRAQDRFSESEKTSAERLRTLLEPVGQRLASYEAQVSWRKTASMPLAN